MFEDILGDTSKPKVEELVEEVDDQELELPFDFYGYLTYGSGTQFTGYGDYHEVD